LGIGSSRSSLVGLLRIEAVQKDLKLSTEEVAKVTELGEKLRTEMREKSAALREIEDREQRRAKRAELTRELDSKARELLRDVLPREKMRRLYQIRLQVRPAVDSLSNPRIARRLQLTTEQQQKLAQIGKDLAAKQSELRGGMRGAPQGSRAKLMQKLRRIRSDADAQALALLTADQKEAFQKMQGEKIELRGPGARRGTGRQAPSEREPRQIREPDVIFVPTPQEVVDKMLEMAAVKKTDVLYDLGCGDGRIVVTAAKKYGCKATGYDIDPRRIRESRANVKKNNVGNLATIVQADIFTLDLSKANVITLYLLPSLNVKLIPQLEKLKPGSRIVSHDFDMRGVKPDKVVRLESKDGSSHSIYFWTTPLKKETRDR
jgi:SAM-dependent methyltransferase